MICSVPSSAAIGSRIWFCRHRESFPSFTSTVFPIEKDIVRSSGSRELHILSRLSVQPVITNIGSYSKFDPRPHNSKTNNSLASTFENNSISDQEASSSSSSRAKKSSRKEKNRERVRCSSDAVIRYPLGTESAMKAMLESNTLVFVVDKRADKTMIKDTVEKMFMIRAKKVNTLITPDGRKKAFVMLGPEFSALDVAKVIKIM